MCWWSTRPTLGEAGVDLVAAVHAYGGVPTVNGMPGQTRIAAESGQPVRVRVVNTDSGPTEVTVSGAAFRVLAVDGTDVLGPTEVRHRAVRVPAGGRVDLGLTTPADGSAVLVQLGASGTPVHRRRAGERRDPRRCRRRTVSWTCSATASPPL